MNGIRVALSFLSILGAADTVFGSQSLPQNLRGVWALEPSDCSAANAADFRIEVTATEVIFAVSLWSAQNWKRSGNSWRGMARILEEGEAGRSKGRHPIALLLNNDNTLTISLKDQPAAIYHRCP